MKTSWSDIRRETSWAPDRFTSQVYQEPVAGKPRMSGALAALEHFQAGDRRRRRPGHVTARPLADGLAERHFPSASVIFHRAMRVLAVVSGQQIPHGW